MTDHRGDPNDGIDQVGTARPPLRSERVLRSDPGEVDPRLDPLIPGRETRPRVRAGSITGSAPVVRIAAAADAPAPVLAAAASTTIEPPAPVRIPRVVSPPEPDTAGGPPTSPTIPPPPVARTVRRPVNDSPPTQAVVRQRPIRVHRAKPRVRRVRRVVRSIDTWTVFKVSAIFYLIAYIIVLVAGVLLWNLANSTGTVDNVERFFETFGWESFEFKGGEIFHSYWIIGLFLVVAGTGLNVTLSVLFNLIADLVGGVGVTVLEEEVRVVRVDEPRAAQGEAGPPEASEPDLWNDITGGAFHAPDN
ncbi:MAG: DUF3566 domain-containing protein [Acidimicrobiia bacterium]